MFFFILIKFVNISHELLTEQEQLKIIFKKIYNEKIDIISAFKELSVNILKEAVATNINFSGKNLRITLSKRERLKSFHIKNAKTKIIDIDQDNCILEAEFIK